MKTEIQNMKRLTIAWIVAGIVAFFMHLIPILVLVGGIYKFLFSLLPTGIAALTVAWRLTVKNAKAVASVLFLLLTLAVLALAGVLIFLIMLTLSLHPIESVLPLCTQVSLIVWYILFFILRKQYSHLIGRSEHSEDV